MRKLLAVAVLAISVSGCQLAREAGRGFTDSAVEALPGLIAESIESKLGDRIDGIGEIGKLIEGIEIPKPIPPAPSDPMGQGATFGIAYLVGRFLADSAKGLVRSKLNGNGNSS